MTLSEAKKLVEFCEGKRVKRVKSGTFEVEFFDQTPEPMKLDPVSLSKALTDSMPPDSAMLFASTEDMNENPTPQTRDSADMN